MWDGETHKDKGRGWDGGYRVCRNGKTAAEGEKIGRSVMKNFVAGEDLFIFIVNKTIDLQKLSGNRQPPLLFLVRKSGWKLF